MTDFGRRNLRVDKEDIAKYVNQLKVWHWLLGFEVDIGDRFSNPFRSDNSPKCMLSQGYKWVFLTDFSNQKFHNWTILHATQHKFRLNFDEACTYIWQRFGDKSVPIEQATPEQVEKEKEYKCIIHFKPHLLDGKIAYLQRDSDYWSPLGISSDELAFDFTYSVLMYRYNDRLDRRFQIYPNSPCYAYTFPSGNVKIYNPYKEIGKWVTNTNKYDIGFLQDIPHKGDVLFICKSYKDAVIQRSLGYTVIWIQGEHFTIPKEIICDLASRYKTIYVFFDNDSSGIEAALTLTAHCNNLIERTSFRPLWLPQELYSEGITDNAEYILAKGRNSLSNLMKKLTNV